MTAEVRLTWATVAAATSALLLALVAWLGNATLETGREGLRRLHDLELEVAGLRADVRNLSRASGDVAIAGDGEPVSAGIAVSGEPR